MNRYAAKSLTEAAAHGRRILVLTARMRDNRDCIDQLAQAAADLVPTLGEQALVRRTNGQENLRYPGGGHIYVRSAASSVRGIAVDTIYLEDEADRIADPDEYMPCLATSINPEIVRA